MKKFIPILKRFWLIWLILGVLLIGFGSRATHEFQRWRALRGEIERTKNKITSTEERVAELQGKLTLVSDPAYLEREARQNLSVKREGEEVLVVVGLEDAKQDEHFMLPSESRVEEANEMWENVRSWFAYFFN